MDFRLKIADDDAFESQSFSATSGDLLSWGHAHSDAVCQSPQNLRSAAALGALRIFCDAVLAICASDQRSQGQSLLQEILPSLVETFSCCRFQETLLRDELVAWTDEAKRLTRQATWHCAENGDQLIERLRFIEIHATQVVEAIAAVSETTTDVDDVLTNHPLKPSLKPSSVGNQSSNEIELTHLLRFCRAMIALASSEPQNDFVVSQVFPTVHLLFQRCTPGLFSRLRAELAASESQVEGLVELAAAHCEPAADELQCGVRRTHALTASVLDALESLYFCSCEASEEECSIATDPTQFVIDPWLPGRGGAKKRAAKDSVRADLHFRMGVRCQRQHLLVAAEKFYLLALAHDDRHYLAHRHCGEIRLAAGQTDEAIEHLTQALKLQGGDAEARRWRADAFASQGRFREALLDYSQLLEQSPNATDVRLSRAIVLRELGESDQAARELEKMLRSGVRSARLHWERGQLWEARGQSKHAMAEFRAALALSPDCQPAAQSLQRLESQQEQHAGKRVNENTSTAAGPANEGDASWSEGEIAHVLENKKPAPLKVPAVQQKRPARKKDETQSSAPTVKPVLPPDHASDETDENPLELIGDQEEISHQPTPRQGVATDSPRLQESIDHTKKGKIAIDCPSCNRQSSMRWSLMEKGKVFVCPRCQVKLVVQEGGRFAKVEQDPEGNWVLEVPHPFWKKDRRTTVGAVAASALMVSLLPLVAITGWQDPATGAVQAPEGLELRSAAFGQAWLTKDYPLIRLLTLRSQQGDLFTWLRNNNLPANEPGRQVQAAIVKQESLSAEVELKLEGSGSAARRVVIHWQKEGGQWLFTPAGASGSATRSKARHKSGSNTSQKRRPRSQSQYQGIRSGPP